MMDYHELQRALGAHAGARGARLEVLGRTLLGREIPMLLLGEGKRTVVYVAGLHGDDLAGCDALVGFAEDYLAALSRRATVFSTPMEYLFEERCICVVPMLNPDGVMYAKEGLDQENPLRERVLAMSGGTELSHWRANARGVDLAHNFAAGFLTQKRREGAQGIFNGCAAGYGGEHPESEPESAALARFLHAEREELLGVLCFQRGTGRMECGCEDNLSAKCMAVGRSLTRITGYPLARPETLTPCGGLGDWCIRALGRPAFTVLCGEGCSSQQLFYAQLRRLFFTFPILL